MMSMSDRARRRSIADNELENLIRGLPRREPRPALRDRILSRATLPRHRRAALLRPAFALAALAALLIADLLALKVQDAGLPTSPKATALTVTAQAPAQDDQDVAWLREMGGSSLSLEVARRSTQAQKQQSYPSLLKALLEGAEGG
jgi:hypothetical protein